MSNLRSRISSSIIDQKKLISTEDEVTNELEHIFLYLSNFKPLEEENSDGEIAIRNQTNDSNDQEDELDSNVDDDEFLYYRSEIVDQMSEIFERRRSNSSSFVLVYNNVHYLNEPVVFGNILDYYFKPNDSDFNPKKAGGTSSTFLHFLTLREVCKSWKKYIDERYGRSFILSIFQDRIQYQDCKPNMDLCLFRLCGLPFSLALVPAVMAFEYSKDECTQAISMWLSFRLTWMIVSGYPVLVPAICCATLVDLAIEKMRERSFFQRLESRYETMEHSVMSEITYFEKCEIVSTIQDSSKTFNKHSCFYIIEVTLNVNGKLLGFRIQKKYTQFKILFDVMCKCVDNNNNRDGTLEVNSMERIEFPLKRWSLFTNPDEIIEERKHVFQKMLNLIVEHSNIFHNSEIYTFFYDRKNQQVLLGNCARESGEEEGFLLVDNE